METALLSERLTALIEPLVADLGYELVLLEFSGQAGALRLFIDAPAGITVDDCEKVSREVAGLLDVEDPIKSAYRLEVSSPGLDRPLIRREHYERFRGETARVQLLVPLEGRRRFQGRIAEVAADAVTLDGPDGRFTLSLAQIERAKLVPDYGQKPDGRKKLKGRKTGT